MPIHLREEASGNLYVLGNMRHQPQIQDKYYSVKKEEQNRVLKDEDSGAFKSEERKHLGTFVSL